MMKNIKYFVLGIFVSLMLPIVSDAATISLEEEKTNESNTAKYNVVLELNPDEEAINSLSLKLEKTNSVENLDYNLVETSNGVISGSCDKSSLTCNLITTTITEKTTIATLTITNNTAQEQATQFSIGDAKLSLSSGEKTVVLKAMPTTTTTTTTTQRVLNTDTDLSSINLSVGTMDQSFNKEITTYNVTGIKDTINSVTITPNCDNNCSWVITCPLGECSVSNSRRVSLQTGANKVSISVTSEDGQNNKSYILNIYRGEIETSSAYLSDIKITDAELSPNFDSMTNDYTTTVGLDVEKLDIITTSEDPQAKVVVKGNENLVEGENTITITVTSSDGENKQVYTIIVTKEEMDEEALVEEEKVNTTKVEKKKNNIWLIITLSLLALGLIILAFVLIFRKKKNNKNKNDKNNTNGGLKSKTSASDLFNENTIVKENTESLNILSETRRKMNEETKQDIDEALDDLMKTKRLELGDLDF